MKSSTDEILSKREFEALSDFRYQLRRFERFSEDAVRAFNITPLQYLLLLHIKGYPGRDYATVGQLAERLQAKPHGVVALISRCEARGLVIRQPNAEDKRRVEIVLLQEGERILTKLAAIHRAELISLKDVFQIPSINLGHKA